MAKRYYIAGDQPNYMKRTLLLCISLGIVGSYLSDAAFVAYGFGSIYSSIFIGIKTVALVVLLVWRSRL